jgi:hypothetical protein
MGGSFRFEGIVMTNPAYVLGHSEFEFHRLARQERLIGRVTRRYLESAARVSSRSMPPNWSAIQVR